MAAVSKAAVMVMVVQLLLLMAAMAAPASSALDSFGAHGHVQEASSYKLGASRRLLQNADCVARDAIVRDCSMPCCDQDNVCAGVVTGTATFNTCIPRTSCSGLFICPS